MAGQRKPTQLKVIAGTDKKHGGNKQEPDPTYLYDLTPPDWLKSSAKAVWEEMAPMAAKAKLLTEVDVQTFAMGCVALAEYRKASDRVDADGAIKIKKAIDEEGRVVEAGEYLNPWAGAQSMYFKQAMAAFTQFGMTPQARTRIAVQPQGDLFGGDKAGSAGYFS
jgi:P27 family predicted phage terminase small subunit